MTNEMIHIGNSAFIPLDKIRVIVPADAGKVRRILKRKGIDPNSDRFWDTTSGLETRALIVLDNGMLVTSFVTSNAIVKRINQNNDLEV
jgi:regulator of extracellular matrix RemA (YlzA/DUF370 family)